MVNECERNILLEKLYEQYYDALVLRCKRYTAYKPEAKDMIEDCVQDVFLKVIQNYRKLVNHPNLTGWLFRACENRMKNLAHTQSVRARKHAFSIDAQASPEIVDVVRAFQRYDDMAEYTECISRIYELLLDEERLVFNDYFLQNMSAKEVAERHNTTEGGAKSMIYRIRKKIKHNLPFPLQIFFLLACLFRK